jgi:glutaconate CoA-transferase subunit A
MSEYARATVEGSNGTASYRAVGTAPWLPDKVATLEEAIGLVRDGDTVAPGGMTLYRRPVAACAELIRQGRRGLTLLDYTGSFEGDILIGAGAVATVRSCYIGMDVLGLAPMHRRAAERAEIEIVDETEATVAYGLRAARARVDFLPARVLDRTDVRRVRPDLASVASPYSGREYVALPAIVPDVAIVHAPFADASGNATLLSEYCLDADLAAAARTTIVTAERIVGTEEIERRGADIVGGWVDRVVEAPRGAYPTSCFPDYDVDFAFLADYVEACADGRFREFLGDRLL